MSKDTINQLYHNEISRAVLKALLTASNMRKNIKKKIMIVMLRTDDPIVGKKISLAIRRRDQIRDIACTYVPITRP